MCLGYDLNLRFPVLRTGVLIIRPLRHIYQFRNTPLSHSHFNPRLSKCNTILQFLLESNPQVGIFIWIYCLNKLEIKANTAINYLSQILQENNLEINTRAGLSLQTQAPRLQFCSKAGLPPQTQGCSFTRDE